jgi:hypothetical protein
MCRAWYTWLTPSTHMSCVKQPDHSVAACTVQYGDLYVQQQISGEHDTQKQDLTALKQKLQGRVQ